MHQLYTLSEETQRKYEETRINLSPYTKYVFYNPNIVTIIALQKQLHENIQYTHLVSPDLFELHAAIVYSHDSIYPKLEGVENAGIKLHLIGF